MPRCALARLAAALAVSLFAGPSYAQGIITTIAGNGRLFRGDGGPAINAQLGRTGSGISSGDGGPATSAGLSPPVPSGSAALLSPLSRVVTPVDARIGGRDAAVQFAGLAPGFVGLYQVNIQAPTGVEPGPAATLLLLQNGAPSNTVTLAVR